MRGARLDADLAEANRGGAAFLQLPIETFHVGMQFVNVGVLPSDLSDFATNGHRHTLRLLLPDEGGEVSREANVDLLLLVQRGFAQVHQGRRVDIDVVEPGGDFLLDQGAKSLNLLIALWTVVLLRVRLDMVALNEQRSRESLAKGGRQHDGCVFVGALLGVPDL